MIKHKLGLFFLFIWITANVQAADLVTYANGAGNKRFHCVYTLPSGEILIGGMAPDLDWIPASVPRIVLNKVATNQSLIPPQDVADKNQNKFAILLQLSADGKTLSKVYTFGAGFGGCILSIKSSGVPGSTSGDIFISGLWTDATSSTPTHNWIAKLNQNFTAGEPSGISWVFRDWYFGTDVFMQNWDVGGDGKIVFYEYKNPGAGAWGAVHRIKADGSGIDSVPKWWNHNPVGISLKPASFDMRSTTQADYDLVSSNSGKSKKKGRYPFDFFFAGPLGINDKSGGYTGYVSDGKAATTCAIAVDRRDNTMYIGFNTPAANNTHDFEPTVMAMQPDGTLKWYTHLYDEWVDANKNDKVDSGETSQCPPDQYIDGVAIDYSKPIVTPEIVVLARSHGNGSKNYWSGTSSFHNSFTGNNGNEHLSWLGRLGGADGNFVNATWLAEYDPWTTNFGTPYSDPILDGWPDHNQGWAGLKTTRARSLSIDLGGNVYVVATSRGPVTTSNAFQKMTKPTATTKGCWADFVRIHKSDFSTLLYSSTLSDPWDSLTGNGGDNVHIQACYPTSTGVVAVGYQIADSTGKTKGAPIAKNSSASDVTNWSGETLNGETAFFAKLDFNKPAVSIMPRSKKPTDLISKNNATGSLEVTNVLGEKRTNIHSRKTHQFIVHESEARKSIAP